MSGSNRTRRDRTGRVFYGWYVLAASFLVLFLNGGARTIIGVMVKPVEADFGWTRGVVSSALFLNMAVYAVSVIITGRLYDRYGPKWVIAGSAVLFSLGFGLMATMHSLWEFLLYYGVINAAGLGGITSPIFGSLIGNWFQKRRGLAVSLAFAGSCLGQFFLIPPFSSMIDVSGWRATALWLAGLSLVLNLVLAFWLLRGDPQHFGLYPYGARPSLSASAAAIQASLKKADERADLTLREAMRSRSLWLFTLVMFVCGGADFLVINHLVPMVTDYGISNTVAASMLAWFGLLSLGGILLAGPATDAIGNKLPIAVTFAFRVALFLMLLFFKGSIAFWVFSLAFGFTFLVTGPLTPTLVSSLYGVKELGFISGFIITVHTFGGAVWVYLGGLIFDSTGNYNLAFLISGILSAFALLCTLSIREKRHFPRGYTAPATAIASAVAEAAPLPAPGGEGQAPAVKP